MKDKRNLTMYMVGRFISFIGSGIQQIALPLYILDITHSAIMMGIFSALNLVPNLIVAPLAGILGDRKNRKNIMVFCDFGRGILVFILGFLAVTGNINIYILFVSQILSSIMDSIFQSSSSALFPELFSGDKLMKLMSVRGGLDSCSMIVGPALGGVIYGLFGIDSVFYLNGISFVVSGICSIFIVYVSKINNTEKIEIKTFFIENAEVLLFIKKNKGLIQLMAYLMVMNLFIEPILNIVLPYVIKNGIGFNSQQYGYLVAIITIGTLLGNIILGAFLNKVKVKLIMNTSLVMYIMMMIIFSITIFPYIIKELGGRSLFLFTIFCVIWLFVGIFTAGINTPINTNIQKLVPNAMRSRFFSFLGMACWGAIPLGSIIYGFLLDKFKYYYMLVAVLIITLLATVVFIRKAVPEVYEPNYKDD
ncbi:MFS transporter [Clostridium felsineum]|uniref:MFS transporter n=1 Tax=Clostridium felsineum TaxID=36839 RepID=UPI00098C2B24|nr:MFS transporter [Clostridium felsineum]URZ03768.1 putative MFS-type transporter YfcJ [Clostridium felsineum]